MLVTTCTWSHSLTISLTLSLRSHYASAQMTKNASALTHTSQVKWGFKLDSDGTRTSYTKHNVCELTQITLNETTSRSLGVVAPIYNDKGGGRDETDGTTVGNCVRYQASSLQSAVGRDSHLAGVSGSRAFRRRGPEAGPCGLYHAA